MEPEVLQFAHSIGASELSKSDERYRAFRRRFKRRNYFIHPSGLLIIKISRIQKPFWGLNKAIIDFVNGLSSYYVILLRPASQGWAFSKAEVNHSIMTKEWNLESTGKEYKILAPPKEKMFLSPKGCLKKLGSA